MGLRIGVGSDHAGRDLKDLIVEYLRTAGHEPTDFGIESHHEQSVDYPDFAEIVAESVAAGKNDFGVLVCGTGIGMCVAANKVAGVRAALVWDEFTARMSRAHNDANVICLGARTTNDQRAIDFLKIWLASEYESGRHQLRLDKVRELEKRHFRPRTS